MTRKVGPEGLSNPEGSNPEGSNPEGSNPEPESDGLLKGGQLDPIKNLRSIYKMSYTDPMTVLVALLVIGLVIAVIMSFSQPSTNTVYIRGGGDDWHRRWWHRDEGHVRPMFYAA